MLHLFFDAQHQVLVTGMDKDWIFHLIFSVYVIRNKRLNVAIICTDGGHERYRLLELMGCRVHRVENATVEGVIVDSEEIRHARALLRCPRASESIAGRYYHSSPDWYAINASFYRALGAYFSAEQKQPEPFVPELQEVSDETLIKALQNVRFYREARITIEDIDVKDTFPSSKFIAKYKLVQIQELFDVFQRNRWQPFRPCGFTLANGKISLVIPPVLEEHNGKLYVAEGHTRIYFLLKRVRGQRLTAAIVRGVDQPLPLTPTRWNSVTEVDEKQEPRIADLARFIETSTHEGVWTE
jgi:hypothetical protein